MTTITLTAGHGQYKDRFDSGAVAKDGTTEAAIAVEMRGIIKYYLERAGVTVITDGIGKQNLGLNDAVKLIKKGKIALEIHTNASDNPKAQGVEVLALGKDKTLAQNIAKAISDTTGYKLRGDKGYQTQSISPRGRLAFVQNGGLILELFFISNPTELQTYRDKKWLIGKAVAGVLSGVVG
ncbi:MAG: N-acetylmuramoyl-L-alanine amidase [Moraxella sp.]|nr:N-acetylmuramoyl-L-alanine amidase [Moraxella sp.]